MEAGSILVAGGDLGGKLGNLLNLATSTVSSATAQVFNANASTPAFLLVSPLNTARESGATVVLLTGQTLIVGGSDCVGGVGSAFGGETGGFTCNALQTAELYTESASGGTFKYAGTSFGANPGGMMTTARSGPTATLISGCDCDLDGDVLIVGGSTGSSYLATSTPSGAPSMTALNTAELYDPTTDTFTAVTAPIPGCPAGEDIISTPPCTGKLASVCALPAIVSPITSVSESGTTVTVTSPANPPGLTIGSSVAVSGVGAAGASIPAYNNVFIVTGIPSGTTFTFSEPSTVTGLATGTGGLAQAGNILTTTESGTTVTATTTVNPVSLGLIVGDLVSVTGVSVVGYDGPFVVTAIPSSTSFQYTPAGSLSAITSASESGTTVTITSVANPAGLKVGNEVVISGVSVAGYNGTFTVTEIGTGLTTFQYTAASGLTAGTGGAAAAIAEGLAAGQGGTAAGQTYECGMVDQGAALIPNDGGQVLLAGGDLVTFLGESSNLSFIFNPVTQTFAGTGNLNTPREEFTLVPMDPSVVKGALSGDVVAFGGIEANSAVCSVAGDIVATTLNTAEVFNPGTGTWSVPASKMGVKRAGAATLIEAGPLAGEVILPGGVDVEAGTLPITCSGVTNLVQAATTETDLYNPGSGTGGTFTSSTSLATGNLNQAREGQGQGVIGVGTDETEVMVIGGACTLTPPSLQSVAIGTSTAKVYCDPVAQADYSEIYSQSTKTWTVGPAPATGFTPANISEYAVLP